MEGMKRQVWRTLAEVSLKMYDCYPLPCVPDWVSRLDKEHSMASASDLKEMRSLAIWIRGRGAQCPPHLEAGEKE